MSGCKYLLDIKLIFYILTGNEVLADLLYLKNLYTSFINRIELFRIKSVAAKEEQNRGACLSHFCIINLNETI